MHICADELRWIPLLLPAIPVAVAFGRRAWSSVCGICARIARRREAA